MKIVSFMDFINTIKYLIIRLVNVIIEPINALIYWLCRILSFFTAKCNRHFIPEARLPDGED